MFFALVWCAGENKALRLNMWVLTYFLHMMQPWDYNWSGARGQKFCSRWGTCTRTVKKPYARGLPNIEPKAHFVPLFLLFLLLLTHAFINFPWLTYHTSQKYPTSLCNFDQCHRQPPRMEILILQNIFFGEHCKSILHTVWHVVVTLEV